MAKTKTKKDEIVDLKPKAEKITDEQLKHIQSVVNSINRKLILFFYYITNSVPTINFLTNRIVHSVVFVVLAYTNLSYQFAHLYNL